MTNDVTDDDDDVTDELDNVTNVARAGGRALLSVARTPYPAPRTVTRALAIPRDPRLALPQHRSQLPILNVLNGS
ncbi:unnamed protein product [Euphydryas editha]|uniref:Uncharacterized protein n=1 Tax=Euphydryas editha TaxID=104508 RepID=A0AAU9UK19_EUPED|nr:unnamed protein product [Euphydryas editha]